jgi:uncharacterized protein YndB with AHSA1/START domain
VRRRAEELVAHDRVDHCLNQDREVVSTRVLNAPREVVFHAFREPEHLAQWWGPKDFRNTFREFDFRLGGHWRLTMHGPDGIDYKNAYVLLEIMEPERIVISHPDPQHNFQLAIILAEEGEKTRLTWRMRFESVEHCNQVKPFIVEANEQNFDRLEAELAKMV